MAKISPYKVFLLIVAHLVTNAQNKLISVQHSPINKHCKAVQISNLSQKIVLEIVNTKTTARLKEDKTNTEKIFSYSLIP